MSNILRFEFKRNIISSLIWVLIAVGFIALYGSFYDYFAKSQSDLFENVPEAFTALVNLTPETFNSYSGYYSFTLTYVNLISSLYFVILAYNLYNRESSFKLNEYLLTKPVSRTSLFISKFSVGLIILIIFNVLFSLLSIVAANFNTDDVIVSEILKLNSLVLINSLFFFVFGSFVAVFNIKIRFSAFLAMPVVFGFFFVSVFQQLLNYDWLIYLSPFTLFNSQSVLTEGYETFKIIYFIVIVLLCISGAYFIYTRKEVK